MIANLSGTCNIDCLDHVYRFYIQSFCDGVGSVSDPDVNKQIRGPTYGVSNSGAVGIDISDACIGEFTGATVNRETSGAVTCKSPGQCTANWCSQCCEACTIIGDGIFVNAEHWRIIGVAYIYFNRQYISNRNCTVGEFKKFNGTQFNVIDGIPVCCAVDHLQVIVILIERVIGQVACEDCCIHTEVTTNRIVVSTAY